MKDENDSFTVDMHAASQAAKPKRRQPGFDIWHSTDDLKSSMEAPPKGARLVLAPGIAGGLFVPVSHVAKDWQVTPRRIRALLQEGRLLGRLQPNGYWEVRFPYSFTFGTRGPCLKRQQRPKRSKPETEKPVLKAV